MHNKLETGELEGDGQVRLHLERKETCEVEIAVELELTEGEMGDEASGCEPG